MVKDDGPAKPKKTLDTPNPDGKICTKSTDGPNLPESEDSQIGKDMEIGARVSADGGDDMSVTLAELSSKRGGKRGAHQLKDGAKEASKNEDLGLTDEKIENTSVSGGDGVDSVFLRRSRRKRIDVDSGDEGKKLKMKEGGEKEKGEEQKTEDEEEDEDEDEEEDESEFSVGDFVWGKVKSHPWWPGRVFDPSDASQQALKYKHEGRILVAYFGDATFAWCDESQLKPFVENFSEMSKQSGSKNFLNAVEEAVTEFGRLVELDMTCYCTPRSEQSDDHQGSALNAGIKGGVNVNKGGIGMYSVDRFNPAAFLDDLRVVGKHASVDSLLELTTLRSWVSAVYRSKDGSLLLKFNEMQEAAEDEGVGAGIEDSVRGPVEEPVQVQPGMPDALVPAKRKERSVAEILYGDEKANEDGDVVEGEKSVKTDSKSMRKKRKVAGEGEKKAGDQEESIEDEILINQSGKRKKKLEEISKGEAETVHGDKPEDEKKVGSRSSRMKAKESPKPIVVETNLSAFEESEMSPRTRERKKSKYLSPPYTNLEYYRQTAVNSPRGQAVTKAVESSNASQSGETSSKSASAQVSGSLHPIVKCSDETSKKNLPKEDGAEHGKPNGSAPGTPRRASSRKVGGGPTKSIASSNNVLSGIRSAALSGQLSKEDDVKGFLSSYRSSKYQNESSCDPCEADDQLGGKGESSEMINHEVVNDEKKNLKKSETKRGKTKLRNKGKVVDSEKDGLEGEVANEGSKSLKKSETKHEKTKLKNKAKEENSEKDSIEERKSLKKPEAKHEKAKLKNKAEEVNSEKGSIKERRSLKKSEAKHEKAKLKSKAEEVNSDKDGNITGTPQSAALHLKFPAGYPLPSIADLGALYGKYGALDTTKTKVVEKSSSARLVFLRGSDAEAASKSSKENSPFGAAEVSYRVRFIKATSDEKEVDENGFSKTDTTNSDSQKRKRSTKKQSKASASDGGLGIVKQKLEGMVTMVAEAGDGNVSSELKLNLESRLKDLLDEVKALPALPLSSGSSV